MTDPATQLPDVPADAALDVAPAQSPWRMFWKQLRRSPVAIVSGILLVLFYLIALFAQFFAPYSQEEMDRERFFHAPHALRWIDSDGHFSLRPFIYPTIANAGFEYEEDRSRKVPVRFFVKGDEYKFLGFIPSDLHLYGVDPPDRIYILGTDPFGRDEWSRLLFGGQISLTVGLIGIIITFTFGMLLGGISGYFGGWVDTLVMRFTELLLSIPGLYLLIALRQIFPNDMPSTHIYLGIIAILAFIGWAGLARIIRGMVLSIRKQEYVLAAEALGVGRLQIIARHILPNTLSFVIVAATLTVPAYILGEVVLSFLGVGVQEPNASWGNMLNQARSLRVLSSFPWLLWAPGIAIFLTVLSFNFLGDGLRDALDPRKVQGGTGG